MNNSLTTVVGRILNLEHFSSQMKEHKNGNR